jgi:uncharacterized protein YdeI (YjbR/CyaY-like superfamily)
MSQASSLTCSTPHPPQQAVKIHVTELTQALLEEAMKPMYLKEALAISKNGVGGT